MAHKRRVNKKKCNLKDLNIINYLLISAWRSLMMTFAREQESN